MKSYISPRVALNVEFFRMAKAEVRPAKVGYGDEDESRVAEFEEGVKRGIEEYKTGQVETFDDKAKFLNHLRNL